MNRSFETVAFLLCNAIKHIFFPPTATSVAQGSLAQITFGAIRCSFNAKFRGRFRYRGKVRFCRVAVQKVSEGSGADAEVRFQIPVQSLGQVPEGSGAEVR